MKRVGTLGVKEARTTGGRASDLPKHVERLRAAGISTPPVTYREADHAHVHPWIEADEGRSAWRTAVAQGEPAQRALLSRLLQPVAQLHAETPDGLNLLLLDPWAKVTPRFSALKAGVLRDVALSAADAARAALVETDYEAPVPVHGDLHVGQFLVDGGEAVWLLDWEDLALGERAFDLGNMAAHLATQDPEAPTLASYLQLEELLLSGYRRWATPPSTSTVRAQAALALIRRALKGLETGWGPEHINGTLVAAKAVARSAENLRRVNPAIAPSAARVRDYLRSHPRWSWERMDVDSKGRATALLRKPTTHGPEFLGAWVRHSTDVPRTFAPTDDSVLFKTASLDQVCALVPGLDATLPPVCVAYRPMKRVVFRAVDLNGDRVFLKVRRRRRDSGLNRYVEGDPQWPELLFEGTISDEGPAVELWAEAKGESFSHHLAGASPDLQLLERVGMSLGRWIHTVPATVSKVLPRADSAEMEKRTQRHWKRWHALFPDEAAQAQRSTPSGNGSAESVPMAPAHGDLHPDQIFVHDEENAVSWIDPDSLCMAPLEWDAANLAAHLDLEAVRRGDPTASPETVDALYSGFQRGVAPDLVPDQDRFQRFRGLCLDRLAAVYACRPRESHLSRGLLRAGERIRGKGAAAALLALMALGMSPVVGNATTPDQLREGMWVEVEVDLDPQHEPGDRFALNEAEVKVPDANRRAKLRGRLTAFTGDRITLLGIDVTFTPKTRLVGAEGEPLTVAALTPGTAIKIVLTPGSRRDNLQAERVEVLGPEDAAKDPEVEGTVESLRRSAGRARFTVNGVRLKADADVLVEFREGTEALLHPPIVVANSVLKRSDSDWQPPGYPVSPTLTVGGRINTRVLSAEEHDLNQSTIGDRVTGNVQTRLYGRWDPSLWTQAYVELRLEGTRDWLESPLGDSAVDRSRFALGPAYILLRAPAVPQLAFQVGRVDVDETREWFYDQNMDGARLFFISWKAVAQIGHYRRELVAPDADERDEAYTIANLVFPEMRAVRPELHVVHRVDRRSPDARSWYGGRLPFHSRNLETWSDFTLARGDYRGLDYKAWAYDVGFLLRTRAPLRASAYAGFASGSGDGDRSDTVDREFRDTGLSDYNDSFDGVRNSYYYGELTRPELSNLRIWTAGAGFRPLDWASVDVVWHRYRQNELRDRFRSELDDIGIRPNGDDVHLGSEIDVILGMRSPLPVDVKLVWARFRPGDAFDNTETAGMLKFEVEKKW